MGSLAEPLEELEEATKEAIDKGKAHMKKAFRATKQVVRCAVPMMEVLEQNRVSAADKKQSHPSASDADGFSGTERTDTAAASLSDPATVAAAAVAEFTENMEKTNAISSPPVMSERADVKERPAMERQKEHRVLPKASSSASSPKPASKSSGFIGTSKEGKFIFVTTVLAAHHTWTCKSAILANQFPLSVVILLVVASFLLGYNVDNFFSTEDDQLSDESGGGIIRKSREHQRRRGVYVTSQNEIRQISNVDSNEREGRYGDEGCDCDNDSVLFRRTRKLARRANAHLKDFGWRYINPKGASTGNASDLHKNRFWSSLKKRRNTDEDKEWQKILKAPFSEGPLMDYLLDYSDFRKREGLKERKRVIVKEGGGDSQVAGDELDESIDFVEVTDITMGRAVMNNTKASSLESNEQFSHVVVDPICELRGMDLFLTDDPKEEIWRQPLLNDSGLRDTPTLIANLMLPFGNMTAYFQLPEWVEDWNNIPEEKDDDPPDIKALKRFLAGDDDYRNHRIKVVPFIVNGPLAIRVIKPAPREVNVYGPRHPAKWLQVPKSIDSCTRKANAAILECNIDLFSNANVRKIINIVRPHLPGITIDVALIISAPKESEIEEPSACLGLWRIEKVDFESAAVFPELPLEDALERVTMLMSAMEGNSAVKVSA